MLAGMATDLNKLIMSISPAVMNIESFDVAKKAAFEQEKHKAVESTVKIDKWMRSTGWTYSGDTYGEIVLFSVLWCAGRGSFPEIGDGVMKPFVQGMVKKDFVCKVISGESKFGQLGLYLRSVS